MDCSTPGFLSIANSWSLLKLVFIESLMPSNQLILCCSRLLLPSVFPSIRVFSKSYLMNASYKVDFTIICFISSFSGVETLQPSPEDFSIFFLSHYKQRASPFLSLLPCLPLSLHPSIHLSLPPSISLHHFISN